MRLLTGNQLELSSTVKTDMGQYRYRVFVEKLRWELDCEIGLEFDQFDRDDTIYVLAQDDEENIIGLARLLPTTRPYLLEDIFPQLMNGQAIPKSDDVWELSRFVAIDFKEESTKGHMQFSSPVAIELLKEAISTSKKHGAKRLITVSPLGVERLLRKAGFRATRAGPPMVIDGHAIFANWIECN